MKIEPRRVFSMSPKPGNPLLGCMESPYLFDPPVKTGGYFRLTLNRVIQKYFISIHLKPKYIMFLKHGLSKTFSQAYPDNEFRVISPENINEFLLQERGPDGG